MVPRRIIGVYGLHAAIPASLRSCVAGADGVAAPPGALCSRLRQVVPGLQDSLAISAWRAS